MPQESRRSLGYRFVTCGDPDGVVECGSIRRSAAKYQKMEAVVENPRKMKSPVRPSRKDRESMRRHCLEGSGGSEVVQLSEASRGAQELNRMIETWSRGASFDGQLKEITKDLLKGALNLQESLILLGKLQEATKCMAQLKQKAEKSEDPQKDTRFQKPRISVDEALDSTYKFRRKEFYSPCDVPSTSSSQSSTLNGEDAACRNESGPFSKAITQQGRVGRSNVIAKLMGLEEIPRIDSRKNSQWKRTTYVDKFSKPQFEVPRVGREPRSLKAILEGMQAKGLLRSESAGNWKRRNDYHPLIVLIKPFAAPVVKAKEQLVQEERILKTEVLLKNAKLKEEIFRKFSDDGKERVGRSKRLDARNEVEAYESSRCRSKVSDRTKEGLHSKKQFSSQVSKNSPKSDGLGRKQGEVQMVRKNSRRSSEEASHSRMSFPDPRCQDNKELTNTKHARPKYSGQNKMKNETTAQQSRTQKNLPKRRIPEGHRTKSNDHNRSPKVKQISVTAEKDIRENEIPAIECEKIDEENNGSHRIEVDSATTEASLSTVTSASVEETDQTATILRLRDDSKNKRCDLDSEDYHVISLGGVHSQASTNRRYEEALLWSDSMFLARLEDMFESFGIYPTIVMGRGAEKDQPRSVCDKLYLDCANEYIKRKNLQVLQNLHSISFTSSGICPSLTSVDKLIKEVCQGINDLNGWCEFADGHLSADGFNVLLRRDMWSKGFATGTWGFGWKDGFSGEEVEQVVSNMEKKILGWLIEEAIAEV